MELRTDKYNKKSIHINVSKDAHAAFRIACFERGLSMQEVFEEFVQQVMAEMPAMIRLLEEVKENKKFKNEKKFSKQDAESLFDLLESNSIIK